MSVLAGFLTKTYHPPQALKSAAYKVTSFLFLYLPLVRILRHTPRSSEQLIPASLNAACREQTSGEGETLDRDYEPYHRSPVSQPPTNDCQTRVRDSKNTE
jgi:hypothetical protein